MSLKQGIRSTVFILIFVILFCSVSKVLTLSSEDHDYQGMAGIYEENEDCLDAVYIGSSNTYAFWNPMVAWEEYGIAVHTYTCSSQPFIIARYLLEEARKTQPDALYIFNVNTIGDEGLGGSASDDVIMHRILDSMPLSINKLKLTDYMCDVADLSFSDRLEFYFPIIKYHSRWDELDSTYFHPDLNGFKGADFYDYYFNKSRNITDKFLVDDSKQELTDVLINSLDGLLDYCDKNKVNALFVTSPRGEEKDNLERINKVNEIIESRGYPTLNLINKHNELNLDFSQDYYNRNHTNIHGSIKYTYYISEYLIENYGFKDKRGNSEYSGWDKGFAEYSKLMVPYVIDFELDSVHRDFEIEALKSVKVNKSDSGVITSWEAVSGADGYAVFRSKNNSKWAEIGSVEELSFVDNTYEKGATYRYAVVPYSLKDNERYFGSYLYNGVEITV